MQIGVCQSENRHSLVEHKAIQMTLAMTNLLQTKTYES